MSHEFKASIDLMIYEKIPGDHERLYNTSILINRQGQLNGVYQKNHMCDAPAFFLYTGKHHWLPLLIARAIENQVYIVVPNQWGEHYQGVLLMVAASLSILGEELFVVL